MTVSGSPNPNATGTYALELMEITSDDHPNDQEGAALMTVGVSDHGNIETPGDVDWFAVDLEAGVTYKAQVQGRISDAGTLLEPRFAGIYRTDGTLIDGTSNNHLAQGGLFSASMEITPATTGTHHIAVSGYTPYVPHRSEPPVGTYTVDIAEKN